MYSAVPHPRYTYTPGQTLEKACHKTHNVAAAGFRYMNPPAPIQHTQTNPDHGIKRSAPDDEVEKTSNISGEFKKLRLNHVAASHVALLKTQKNNDRHALHHSTNGMQGRGHVANAYQNTTSTKHQHAQELIHLPPNPPSSIIDTHNHIPDNDRHNDQDHHEMTIDETPHRIYIPSLAAEIASIEASEAFSLQTMPIFLPQVNDHLSKIPSSVLRHRFTPSANTTPPPNQSQALILYKDPSSISIPAEEDAVRKAILQARKEARHKMEEQTHEKHKGAGEDGKVVRVGVGSGAGVSLIPRPVEGRREDDSARDGMSYDNNASHEDDDADAMDLE